MTSQVVSVNMGLKNALYEPLVLSYLSHGSVTVRAVSFHACDDPHLTPDARAVGILQIYCLNKVVK